MKGKIANLSDRGFGFITPEEGDKDLFFHARSLVEGLDFNDLKNGDEMTFEVEDGGKGSCSCRCKSRISTHMCTTKKPLC